MKTPWTLRKTETIEPATGLLLFTQEAAEPINLCVALAGRSGEARKASGDESAPTIFAVAGGFLLRPDRATTQVFPGVIRLRQLTANLFLPVDADLWPALFPDELAGLVHQRGLIFLPGGRILAFAPDRPVALADLLRTHRLPRGGWRPLPTVPLLAERLTEILLDRPAESSDAVLSPGGEGIGVEEPQTPEVGPGSAAGAHVKQGLGQGLDWLGRLLGWKALAAMGRAMAQAARQTLQKISPRTLDRQEAALRELLRQFQDGNLDDALRRALPLGEQGGRGGQPTKRAALPTHNLNWSLGSVVGDGHGPAGLWMGGAELQSQLAAEYRKAAEAATARGDFRRAAFIYGKLLRDYRLAADVLSRGGLYHDAAILYLDKLDDVLAAARAFESAGELDRAVALYRKRSAHVPAGDLLRKMGEEEQARQEYRLAIENMGQVQEHHAAGELALQKLHDGDLAEACFRVGWGSRQRGAIPCLLRLAGLLAERSTPADLWTLIAEAEPFLARGTSESDTAAFYNELVRLGDRPHLAASRDALRDRALLGLAARLRQRGNIEARSGGLVSTLLGQSNLWSAAQVSDAEAAVKAVVQTRKVQNKPAGKRAVLQVRIHPATVTAACMAAERGKLFLAFDDGAHRCFNANFAGTIALPSSPFPPMRGVQSLATDPLGELLVSLCSREDQESTLITYLCVDPPSDIQVLGARILGEFVEPQLSPLVRQGDEAVLTVWDENTAIILRSQLLLPEQRLGLSECLGFDRNEEVLGILPVVLVEGLALLVFDDHNATLCPLFEHAGPLRGAPLGWIAQPAANSLSSQVLWSSVQRERLHVEIVRVGSVGGHIYWSRLGVEGGRVEAVGSAVSKTHNYLAAALVVPWRIAAVHEGGMDWLRIQGRQLLVDATTEINLSGAVGCFFSPPTGEVLVVCRDGYLIRVSVPQ